MAARGGSSSAAVTAPEGVSEMWDFHLGAALPGTLDAFDWAPYPAVATGKWGCVEATSWRA